MQSLHRIALWTIILAGYNNLTKLSDIRDKGSANGCLAPVMHITRGSGTHFEAVIDTRDVMEKCYITTPFMKNIHIKPNDRPEYKYELLEDTDGMRCRVRVRALDVNDTGLWTIYSVSTEGLWRSQTYNVTVTTPTGAQVQDENKIFNWITDQPVQEIFGPEDAIYCKVVDPHDFVVFEDFGRCNITLPRATMEHDGNWTMSIGLRHPLKATVKTEVTANKPQVTLSCSVSSPYPIRACKFRDPSRRILMANPGVSEDRYTFHGKESSYESGIYTHFCGIQISSPLILDLGFWRCAIETISEAYYGFLNVQCPWVNLHSIIAPEVSKVPVLTAVKTPVQGIVGDSVLLSCSVQSSIRYCYFRASNGTVYSVGPGFSSLDMAVYAGAGLDAGECSIRFRSLTEADSRRWSCHVGFDNNDMPEQNAHVDVDIRDIMTVTQIETRVGGVIRRRRLDYCRFVRHDGLGFTSEAAPEQYYVQSLLTIGECVLHILRPSMLDAAPWTVVMRITGQRKEIARTTRGAPFYRDPVVVPHRFRALWIDLVVSFILFSLLAAVIARKKTRRWLSAKFDSVSNYFRQRSV